MALTKKFKDSVQERVQADPAFRQALFEEAMNAMFCGEVDAGKAVLRDYINATVGFEALAEEMEKPAKSLHRMFGPQENPTLKNLIKILNYLQRKEGVQMRVKFTQYEQEPTF